MTVTLTSAFRFSAYKIVLCNDSENVHLPFNFLRLFFVDVHSTFMSADELFHKFDVCRNSDVRTDRGRPLRFVLDALSWPRFYNAPPCIVAVKDGLVA